MEVAVTLMGGFAVTVGDSVVDPAEWRRRQAASLVKVLALGPRRGLHRERVIDALWPGLTIEEAAPRLHKAAHFARRAIGLPNSVVLTGDLVALLPATTVHVDAEEFRAVAEAAVAHGDPREAAHAADAYGGELLPDDLYEAWADDDRIRLHDLYLDLLRLAGRWHQLTLIEPTDEDAHLRVVAELARSGDRRAAIRQFERLEAALSQELGVSPSRAALRLRARLEEIPRPATARTEGQPVGEPGGTVIAEVDRARVAAALDSLAAGRGRCLFIAGPAGIGKTTLLRTLEHEAGARGLRVGTGVAARIEGAWPYAPVLEAIADLCRRHPTLLDGLADPLRAEIDNALSGRSADWTAQSGHQRLFVAVTELVRLAAAGAGAVLVIDDAHQIDRASLRLMHFLARGTVGERVLLVLAHRPEVSREFDETRQSLASRHTAAVVDVTPMTDARATEMVRRVAADPDEAFVRSVVHAAEGNPGTIARLARGGGQGEAWTELLGPATTGADRLALASTSLLGTHFSTEEFLGVAGLSEDDAYAVLDRAMTERVLIRLATGFEFRHRQLRDALVESLRPSELKDAHLRAAVTLEALGSAPGRISHHLVQAGKSNEAVPWLLRAAQTSAALGAYAEALDALAHVVPHAHGVDLTAALALRADVLVASADSRALDAYRAALASTSDPTLQSPLRAKLAKAAAYAGDLETAEIALDGLELDDTPADMELLFARGVIAFFRNDHDAAETAATEARRRSTLGRPDEWQAFELITLQGLVAHNRGQYFQRLAQELRSGAGRPAVAARIFDSHLCAAEFLLYGPTPYPEVLRLAAELRDTAQRSGALRAVAFATALRGETALLMGNLELAESELNDAVALHRDVAATAGEAHSLQRLAEVKMAQGDRLAATGLLQQALPLARYSTIAHHLLQRVYGSLIAASDDVETARGLVDYAESALGVTDQCRYCNIMLSVPAIHACLRAGDLAEARRHLADAEKSLQLWEGTAWQAAILEAKAHLQAADGDREGGQRLLASAANLYDVFGQPLDAQRCRTGDVAMAIAAP